MLKSFFHLRKFSVELKYSNRGIDSLKACPFDELRAGLSNVEGTLSMS